MKIRSKFDGTKGMAWGLIFLLAVSTKSLSDPLPLCGVNIAGGEFWLARKTDDVTPRYGVNYSYPTKAEIDYFAGKGMNFFRYQFLWETLQPQLRTRLNQGDLDRLKTSVEYATSKKLVVLLDPHDYARYYETDIIGGSNVSAADFADFWRRLAREFADNPYVWFGLMNEPHSMPTQQWFDDANVAIAAIRSSGAKNMILVPGNAWTGAHSWTSEDYGGESNARGILTIKDPLNYWAIEVHQYLDDDSSGTHAEVTSPTIGSERLKEFVDWCRQNKMHAFLGEFAVPVTTNGEAALDDMLSSMERDNDVWLGWSWWAAGARWGDYLFTLEPKNGEDRTQMTWLKPHLPGTSVPQFSVSVKNGSGSCTAEACTVSTVEAVSDNKAEVFKGWAGDTTWLKDSKSPKTTILVPFKNVEVEAVFEKRTDLAAAHE
ncbi:MAG TPA: glycoside hydrolase family 5 protein [Verrucomicrobiae bacterium]